MFESVAPYPPTSCLTRHQGNYTELASRATDIPGDLASSTGYAIPSDQHPFGIDELDRRYEYVHSLNCQQQTHPESTVLLVIPEPLTRRDQGGTRLPLLDSYPAFRGVEPTSYPVPFEHPLREISMGDWQWPGAVYSATDNVSSGTVASDHVDCDSTNTSTSHNPPLSTPVDLHRTSASQPHSAHGIPAGVLKAAELTRYTGMPAVGCPLPLNSVFSGDEIRRSKRFARQTTAPVGCGYLTNKVTRPYQVDLPKSRTFSRGNPLASWSAEAPFSTINSKTSYGPFCSTFSEDPRLSIAADIGSRVHTLSVSSLSPPAPSWKMKRSQIRTRQMTLIWRCLAHISRLQIEKETLDFHEQDAVLDTASHKVNQVTPLDEDFRFAEQSVQQVKMVRQLLEAWHVTSVPGSHQTGFAPAMDELRAVLERLMKGQYLGDYKGGRRSSAVAPSETPYKERQCESKYRQRRRERVEALLALVEDWLRKPREIDEQYRSSELLLLADTA
jgi:hypothetical protein